MKRFFKYFIRTLLAIIGLLLLIVFLLYLPPVQNLIRKKAVDYISSHYQLDLKVGHFRLGFPLKLVLEDVYVAEAVADTSAIPADTLAAVGALRVQIGLGRIFQKELKVDQFELEEVKFNLSNDTTGLKLRVAAGEMGLKARKVDLKNKSVEVEELQLAKGNVFLQTGTPATPDTTASTPLDWMLEIDRIQLQQVGYRMETPDLPYLGAGIATATLTGGKVGLGTQIVDIQTVDIGGGWCNIKTAGMAPEDRQETTDTTASVPWTVRAGKLRLENSAFSMITPEAEKMNIVLSDIGIEIDSVYNRGTVIQASLKDLHAVEQKGVKVETMTADIDLDTTVTSLQGVYIRTANSQIRLQARADSSLAYLFDKVPLAVDLNARVGLADIVPFYDGIPAELKNQQLDINTAFRLSENLLDVDRLKLVMPGYFNLDGNGKMTSWQDLQKLTGTFDLTGKLDNIGFANVFLKEAGVHLPRNIQFATHLNAAAGALAAVLKLTHAGGMLDVDAAYRIAEEKYDLDLRLADFPLDHFLDVDSIGRLTAAVRLDGRRMTWQQAEVKAAVDIEHFLFRKHDYRDIALEASLENTRIRGTLTSQDPDALLALVFQGDSVGHNYVATLNGRIGEINLQALDFMPEVFRARMDVDIEASMGPAATYGVHARLDSLQIADARNTYALGKLAIDMTSDLRATTLDMHTGDLKLAFQTDTSLAGFAGSVGKVAEVISRQVTEKNIDMEVVRQDLPVFSFRLNGSKDNAVYRFLKTRNMGFDNLNLDVVSRRRSGLRVSVLAKRPHFGTVRLDSVNIGAWQTGKSLVYAIGAGSSNEAWKGLFNVGVTGRMQGDRFRLELKQKDAQGQIGFDLGVNLIMQDSAFTVSFFPVNPILGYRRWIVNPDNRIIVNKDWKINANLRMAYLNKLISFQSLPDEGDQKDRMQIEIAGLDLSSLSRMVPFMPDMKGLLHSDLLLFAQDGSIGVQGELGVTELNYNQQRIGSVDIGLQYAGRNRFTDHQVDFELRIDSIRRAVAKGMFSTSAENRDVRIDMDIPSFPLYVVNAFVPADILQLRGDLTGGVHLRGTLDRPQLSGDLAFRQGLADVVMIGTTFGLDSTRLKIQDGKLKFRKYRFIAPNHSDMVLNGEIVLTPFDQMALNLSVKADDFEVVNVKKNATSLIYGKAYVDLDAQLAGAFSDLSVTGNVALLNRTNITYTLRSSDPEVVDRTADLVRFVSFQDSTLNQPDDLTNRVNASSFALRMLIEIGDEVGVTVELSDDGSNNIFIQGGGNLVLAMNPESGMTLSGKYILSGGTVVYNVPIAGKKEFNIRSGSYVEWTGNLMNPMLNISASEQVKATVEDGDRNRLVTFESIIRIQNTLTRPDITFDLSAPNDMVIQNQLTTFSQEERTRQALNLLIYNTYTAPGAAKSGSGGNMANNALYSFVENELNKYTRKTGLTFGVDSYNTDENTTRTDYTYQFSKQLFNDRVRVKIGGRISTDNNEMQGGGNVQDNLVDDISIEYVFTKKRNLFLKVFRHSNYESVLDGEVTQTGIGIVWRKNFRKLKDLFKHKDKREKLKEAETESNDPEE